MHVVVDHGGEQIVRRTNCVEIAGKVQVDVGHRHDLRKAAARRTAFHAETGSEARLAQAHECLLADLVEAVPQSYRRRCLAFSRRSR